MDLENDFLVPVGIEEAWTVLNDVARIAPCLPGAQLEGIEGDEMRGNVKVKVGPITTQYKGTAHYVEQNHAEKRIVIDGSGRETRGSGNAHAIITAQLEAQGPTSTKVSVHTDLKVNGKVAQFGRGVMADISGKLMGQFADNLEALIVAEGVDAPATEEAAVPKTSSPETEAVDMLDAAGLPMLKRAVPVLAGIVGLFVLRYILRRRRS